MVLFLNVPFLQHFPYYRILPWFLFSPSITYKKVMPIYPYKPHHQTLVSNNTTIGLCLNLKAIFASSNEDLLPSEETKLVLALSTLS